MYPSFFWKIPLPLFLYTMSLLLAAVRSKAPNSPMESLSLTPSSDSSEISLSSHSSDNTSASSGTETPPPSSAPWSNLAAKNSLERYVVKAYYKYDCQDPRPFFRKDPILQKDKPNRILLYYGCFNPPHIAHLNLLRHVYAETCSEFNVVAAFVLPRPEFCVSKFADRKDKSHLYSVRERMELW